MFLGVFDSTVEAMSGSCREEQEAHTQLVISTMCVLCIKLLIPVCECLFSFTDKALNSL